MSRVELAIAVGWLLIVGLGSAAYFSNSPTAPAEVMDFRAEQSVFGADEKRNSVPSGTSSASTGMSPGGLDGSGSNRGVAQRSSGDSPAAQPGYQDDPRSDRSRSFAQSGGGTYRQPGNPSTRGWGSNSAGVTPSNLPRGRNSASSPASTALAANTDRGGDYPQSLASGSGFGGNSSAGGGRDILSQRPEPPTAYAYHDEEYYCRTAREVREACESGGLQPDRYDFCLSFGGYYGNSRFCGYHP